MQASLNDHGVGSPDSLSNDNHVTFVGQYSPFAIDDSNINSVIMLGAKNTLGYSKNPRQLHSFRAHFEVPETVNVREFILDFGDESTGIVEIRNEELEMRNVNEEMRNDVWYTLDSRKLDGKPTKPGLYIVNGKKVVIK